MLIKVVNRLTSRVVASEKEDMKITMASPGKEDKMFVSVEQDGAVYTNVIMF